MLKKLCAKVSVPPSHNFISYFDIVRFAMNKINKIQKNVLAVAAIVFEEDMLVIWDIRCCYIKIL